MSYAIHNKGKVFQNRDYIKRQLNMLYEENMEFKTTINSNIQSYNKLSKYSNELEDRIEKAIKYIEDTSYKSYFGMLQADYNMSLDTLINILKGVDKE